jgi:hypothetical protein
MVGLWRAVGKRTRLGKIGGNRVKEVEKMEAVKEKVIELLLDIISKENFEIMLYEKVKSEDLIKNKLLFDLVDIDYRKDYYKERIINIYQENINNEVFIIYKANFYCSEILNSKEESELKMWFEKIVNLFSFEEDYGLMWNFIELSDRLGFIYMKYEKEENVLKDIKSFSEFFIERLKKTQSIEEKYKLLQDGIDVKYN